MGLIAIRKKNKISESQNFGNKKYNSTFLLKNKKEINKNNIISYSDYNKHLNRDYVNTLFKYILFFIIAEDKTNYLLVEVIPLFPPDYIQK